MKTIYARLLTPSTYNPFLPKKVTIELTNNCNLKCKMCGIWAEQKKFAFPPEKLRELLRDESMAGVCHVALTGGEPFLLGNLLEYYSIIRKESPQAYVNISTNGYFPERVIAFLEKTKGEAISIAISFDGVDSHDLIRGTEQSSKRLLDTAMRIKRLFPHVPLGLKMTITPFNYKEIYKTAAFCFGIGIPFRIKTMEKLENYHNRHHSEISEVNYDEGMKKSIVAQAKEMLRLGMTTNRAYIKKLIRKYEGGEVRCPCEEKTLFIAVTGDVFLCRQKNSCGNIMKHPLSLIWKSPQRRDVEMQMRQCVEWKGNSLPFMHD